MSKITTIKEKTQPIVVNIFGGPGAGKSTTAARIFSHLKENGYKCELVTEYAKDVTWEEAFNKLNNQLYIFAKQNHRIWRVSDKVDVIITDSPLILSLVYGGDTISQNLKNLIVEEYTKFPYLSVYLERFAKYEKVGRTQTKKQAEKVDKNITDTFKNIGLEFDLITPGHKESTEIIVALIDKKIQDEKNRRKNNRKK